MLQLAELFKSWPCTIKGSIRVEITKLQEIVQQVERGDGYVVGQDVKEHKRCIWQAVSKGAAVVIVDDELLYDELVLPVPIVWVPNCATFSAFAHAKLHGFPGEALQVIAVTGTAGKTTFSKLLGQLLTSCGQRVAIVHTEQEQDCVRPQRLQPFLQRAVRRGVEYVILEASSVHLARHYFEHCFIDIGVFLNMAPQHIEEHGSLSKYRLAKQQLVQLSDCLVVNQDDAFCRSVGAISKKTVITFSLKQQADVTLQQLVYSAQQTTCCIQCGEEQVVLSVPFAETELLYDVTAAVAIMMLLGFSLEQLVEPLKEMAIDDVQ